MMVAIKFGLMPYSTAQRPISGDQNCTSEVKNPAMERLRVTDKQPLPDERHAPDDDQQHRDDYRPADAPKLPKRRFSRAWRSCGFPSSLSVATESRTKTSRSASFTLRRVGGVWACLTFGES